MEMTQPVELPWDYRPWPLLEVICLRGYCRRNATRRNDGKRTGQGVRDVVPLDLVYQRYGRRFQTHEAAFAFMDTQVELEKQRARDRAAAFRVSA